MNPFEPSQEIDPESAAVATIVVKLGGTEGVDFSAICRDSLRLLDDGKRLIFVHGGSADTNALGEALGYPPRFVTSPSGYTSRYTDRRTMEIFLMAVNGKINSLLVETLQRLGVNAFGLSGIDGRLIRARRKASIRIVENGRQKVLREDHTGKISGINTVLLDGLSRAGLVPVIAPIAAGEDGTALNVDADRAAAMVAAAVRADALYLLTGAPGLLRSFPDEDTLIRQIPAARLQDHFRFAQGRMKKKLLAAEEAIQGGVARVIIADGRGQNPISELLAGAGTSIQA